MTGVPTRAGRESTGASPARRALRAAGGVAALGALTGMLALGGSRVPHFDERVLRAFNRLDTPATDRWFSALAHLADPVPYILVGVGLIAVAWKSGRRDLARLLLLMLIGSGASSQILKHVLAEPRTVAWLGTNQVGDASWPSGHATAALTLALAAMLVVPAARRPAAALFASAYVLGVCTAVLALAWHFPSDVIGGLCVASVWGLLTAAILMRRRKRAQTPAARASVATD